MLALPRLKSSLLKVRPAASSVDEAAAITISDWALQLQLPTLGVTLLDDLGEGGLCGELLRLSLRGVRVNARTQSLTQVALLVSLEPACQYVTKKTKKKTSPYIRIHLTAPRPPFLFFAATDR